MGYGAGFIDYFFRGRIEIAPPAEGVYGIVDHAADHAVVNGTPYKGDGSNPNAGNVFGFDRIRAKLKNATPDINDGTNSYPQEFSNGELLAVARFRRNPCYADDLSGEFDGSGGTANGCSLEQALLGPEEVLLSAPIPITNLDRSTFTEYEFDFRANPIPVNATSLVMQWVYRGQLGSEMDAVVVATKDLLEPTYLSYANDTDYININGTLYTPAQVGADPLLQAAIDQAPQGNNNGCVRRITWSE